MPSSIDHRCGSLRSLLTRISFARLFAAVGLLALTPPAQSQQLTFDLISGEKANGKRAEQVQFRPGSEVLTYVWDDGSGRKLWALDAATAKSTVLVDYGALPPASPAGQGGPGGKGFAPASYAWSKDGKLLLFEAAGDLFTLEPPAGSLRRLTSTAAEEERAQLSPDGARVAFVREANLYVLDRASGEEQALTSDGKPGEVLNGTTDWVYWEEIWGRNPESFWWSPDGTAIGYYHFDDRDVPTYPVVDYRPTYPEVDPQRYPKAGQTNPTVRFGVVELATQATRWLATGGDPTDYLARLAWSPDSRELAVQRMVRGQDRIDVLACSRADGSCRSRLVESWPTWVNLGEEFRWLADGTWLWGSERDGWRHLYRIGKDGSARRLTPEGWAIASLDAVLDKIGEKGEGKPGLAIVTAYPTAGLGPAGRQVLAVRLDGSGFRALSEGRGWHAVGAASDAGLWVENTSDADTPRPARLRRLDGAMVAELPYEPAPGIDLASLPKWEFLTIPGPGGSTLPARMLKPRQLEPGKKLPVLMYHYGGPGSQVVVDRWGGARELWNHLMVQRGFVVFEVDNQASLFFGKRGEDLLHRRFGEVELAGQLAGVEYLKSLPYVDGTRLGLWGWSGGGSNTLYSVLRAPGVWKAAVAGAPVTDWSLYDSVWTERYLDSPQENPEGYRLSSAVTHAAALADALLVLHGTGDDNVHPQNSLHLFSAFVDAKRPFEQALYPGQKHGFRGAAARHSTERMTEFFERHLLAP